MTLNLEAKLLGRGKAANTMQSNRKGTRAFQSIQLIVSDTKESRKFLVAIRPGDTPVPIPNTMVKTRAADDTTLETAWESRWLPDQWAYSSAG